jgi:hypothetical protein
MKNQVPTLLIVQVDLKFELGEEKTFVSSKIRVVPTSGESLF